MSRYRVGTSYLSLDPILTWASIVERLRFGQRASLHAFVLCAAIALSLAAPVRADERPFSNGSRTRGLTGGWGHSWRPLFGKTRSQITFVAFAPRMGWFVTDPYVPN